MPIYEYRCPSGHVFELFQRMSDAAPETCEVCGASPVEKVLFPVAVHFKGSGFYATDYGKKSRRGSGESTSEPAKPKEAKSDGGGDKKKSEPAKSSD